MQPYSSRRGSDTGSVISRSLEPLVTIFWPLFLIWSGALAVIWLLGIGEVEIQEGISNGDLRAALQQLLAIADVGWVLLGAANCYLALVSAAGLSTARRWALIVIIGAWVIAACSVWTGFPLGPIRFTSRFGFRIGPVPLGWLLLWFCGAVGARDLSLRLNRKASHATVAWMTGGLVGLLGIVAELAGWKIRAWWLWSAGRLAPALPPPLYSYLAWACAGAALAYLLREEKVRPGAAPGLTRPAIIFLTIFALLFVSVLTNAAR